MTTTKIELRTVLCADCGEPMPLNTHGKCPNCDPPTIIYPVPDRTGNAILAIAGLIVLALFVVGVAAGVI